MHILATTQLLIALAEWSRYVIAALLVWITVVHSHEGEL